MRTIRIHADMVLAADTQCVLAGQAGEHVTRVLRLVAGDALVLFNGDGCDYAGTIIGTGKHEVRIQLRAAQSIANESSLKLTLVQGVARGEKMDLIMQKATELGVAHIVPVLTERSEVKLDAARAAKRLSHWRAVVASACEQSGRARLPHVCAALPLSNWLGTLSDDNALRLALLPGGGATARSLEFGSAGGLLVVGPEGGLGAQDLAALDEARFYGVRLGPRILRTETAGLAALAALQALHGDL